MVLRGATTRGLPGMIHNGDSSMLAPYSGSSHGHGICCGARSQQVPSVSSMLLDLRTGAVIDV